MDTHIYRIYKIPVVISFQNSSIETEFFQFFYFFVFFVASLFDKGEVDDLLPIETQA